MASVLGPCVICEAPMSAHAVDGRWIGCPVPIVLRPLDIVDITIRALDRPRTPDALPLRRSA